MSTLLNAYGGMDSVYGGGVGMWVALVVVGVLLFIVAWYAYYPGEVFQLILPSNFFGAYDSTDSDGFIKGLSAADLTTYVNVILKNNPTLFDSSVRIATEADMMRYLEVGGQCCSGSCFISGTGVKMGYVVQQAAPGSCIINTTQIPKLVIDANIKGWPPFGVSLYGRKPSKLLVESRKPSIVDIFPFYKLGANENALRDVWSYRDTRLFWFGLNGTAGFGSDWSYFRDLKSKTDENVKLLQATTSNSKS